MALNVPHAHTLAHNIRTARQELPGDWFAIIRAEARQARSNDWNEFSPNQCDGKEAAIWQNYLDKYGGPMASALSDSQINEQARTYAREAGDLEIGELTENGELIELTRLVQFCRAREVSPPSDNLDLAGRGARVRCQYWWRRALRKRVARKAEGGHQAMGLVSAPYGQPYASNQAVLRRLAQNSRNKSALENITLENDAGYRRTLAELSATSTSNKAIRRGELMTRIRGCEEIADDCGHPGIFATLTCPSRFHSTTRYGNRNPKHAGATPVDGQAWLNDKWRKTRAKAARAGIKVYGFRVAEPHHDGCPHWHLLVWSDGDLATWQAIVSDYWLSDAGDENGADKVRTSFKKMEAGNAAGYIAKYISKNIDDHGIDSHVDDYSDFEIGPDLIGDLEVKPSARVEAWASHWGIRQFQALGQPPVTVWRELRRVAESSARDAGVGGMVHTAWLAVQKTGDIQASWARYVKAQGGMGCGRNARIKMRHDRRLCDGLYGSAMRNIPVGVALNCKGSRTVWSERRFWRPVDKSASVPVLVCESKQAKRAARTGVNNCTHDESLGQKNWVIATDKSGSWTTENPRQAALGNTERKKCLKN